MSRSDQPSESGIAICRRIAVARGLSDVQSTALLVEAEELQPFPFVDGAVAELPARAASPVR
jgi:hypothetical protein